MTKPKLTYFDAPVSRGEECRLALHVAGIDFEDVRIKFGDWPAHKDATPFGALPTFELPGHPPLAQTNAILVLIGRMHGLHPSDPLEAARHEELMCHVEELRGKVSPTLRIADEAEKRAAREDLAKVFLPTWGARAEARISERGPFLSGEKLHVADIKLHMAVRWFAGGKVDHIPADVLSGFPKLNRVHDAVGEHPRVRAFRAASS